MSFAEGYVDVATRLVEFREKHPEGCLQPQEPYEPIRLITVGERVYLQYIACAYRTPDDPRPGIGIAWEPYPGKTPYTRDSEAMVAETSAWGRAIVAALAADTKRGIASREEVQNRSGDPLAAAKARAWGALKKRKPDEDNDALTEFTKAALEARGSSLADASAATWNQLAQEWEAA